MKANIVNSMHDLVDEDFAATRNREFGEYFWPLYRPVRKRMKLPPSLRPVKGVRFQLRHWFRLFAKK